MIPKSLKHSVKAADFSEAVISLGITKTELEGRDTWETPFHSLIGR